MFSRSGFVIFVSVTPAGDGTQQVRLQNQGNVKPGKLPVPPNAKPVYVGNSRRNVHEPRPPSLQPRTPAAISSSRKAGLRGQDRWGFAMFKQNANLVTATIVRPRPRRAGRP